MRVLFTFSLFLFSSYLIGQVVCIPGTAGVQATDEFPGCRMCINVYDGSNAGYTTDVDLNDACGSVENSLWLSFVADNSGMFQATFLANSCTNGAGLELSLFDKDKNRIECFTSNGNGQIATNGLLPGEIHYVMIDGINGDVCSFTFLITGGGTNFGAPGPVGEINVDNEGDLCAGAEVCYTLNPITNANQYLWIVPQLATIIDGGEMDDDFVCVRVQGNGAGIVTVTPSNDCFNGTLAFKQLVVLGDFPGPNISCASTSEGIEFTWDDLPDADNYQVFINGQMVTSSPNTSYIARDLMDGAFVNIRVQAEGACTFQLSQMTCSFTLSSVEQNFVSSQLQVIPNPTVGNVRIETDLQVEQIAVYNTTGKLIVKETNTVFDLKNYGAGIYFLKIKTDEGVGVKRVLVN